MFKLAVLSVIFWHGAHQISGAPQRVDDNEIPVIPSIHSPTMDERDYHIVVNGTNNFYVTQQIFYLSGASLGKDGVSTTGNNIGNAVPSNYTLTTGIAAFKLHHQEVTWNIARHICIQEGGHLAVIRSDAEENIVRKMLIDASINYAWLGFHDLFEAGEWVSVLDEPPAKNGWVRVLPPFTSSLPYNCAIISKEGTGMDSATCGYPKAFICNIPTN